MNTTLTIDVITDFKEAHVLTAPVVLHNCANNYKRIRDNGGHNYSENTVTFGKDGGCKYVIGVDHIAVVSPDFVLDALVDEEVDDGVGDAHHGGREPLEQTAYSLLHVRWGTSLTIWAMILEMLVVLL